MRGGCCRMVYKPSGFSGHSYPEIAPTTKIADNHSPLVCKYEDLLYAPCSDARDGSRDGSRAGRKRKRVRHECPQPAQTGRMQAQWGILQHVVGTRMLFSVH